MLRGTGIEPFHEPIRFKIKIDLILYQVFSANLSKMVDLHVTDVSNRRQTGFSLFKIVTIYFS